MSRPLHPHSPISKGAAIPSKPKSSFGYRFHQAGQPNVYFRTEPDLTSDPNQIWVALDTSEIKFENYTQNNMPYGFDSTSQQEQNGDDIVVRSPKRQKIDSIVQRKAVKTSSMAVGFRVDKPVKTNISDDIWRTILKESHPTVLLVAKNLNHFFHDLLQEQSIWRASRTKLHGEDMPGPPGEMTEQRYAHLLYGQGCDFQKSKCGSNVTKKVYWPFLLRMCDACFRRKTEKDKAVRASTLEQTEDSDIFELIPAGTTSSGKYVRTRRPGSSGWEVLVRAVYLRSDLEGIVSEHQEMVRAGIPVIEIDSWKAEKRANARALMAQCTRIEDFQKDFVAAQPRHREARIEFFAAQAANLTPPLSKDVMEKTMAFKMSLDSNHAPTMRSWGDLKKKLLPHRAAAEQLLDLEQQNERYRRLGQVSPAIRNYRLLHPLRSSISPHLPEQMAVLGLGRKILRGCKDRAVADADLLLLVLKGVFDAYQQLPIMDRPQGTNSDLSRGVYRLTLDDARMIVREVIQPEVRAWDDNARSRVALDKFKCVGCVRKDCTTRYTFCGIFLHILEKHAIHVAEGEDFHKLYRPFDHALQPADFPWYTVEWPKNLPVAASHQKVSKEKKWLADAEVAYVPAAVPANASAFSGRRPSDNSGVVAEDFEGNLMFATTKLRPTTLNVLCQMRIALQYALDRYAVKIGTAQPSLADFMACLPKLQAANEDFTLNFGCGVCKQNPDIPQSAIHRRPEPLLKLREHFEKTHSTCDWTTSLMDLPSDTQLATILQDADELSKKEKQATEERLASLAHNPRKKAQPHATMILERPEAMAVFEELFVRIDA